MVLCSEITGGAFWIVIKRTVHKLTPIFRLATRQPRRTLLVLACTALLGGGAACGTARLQVQPPAFKPWRTIETRPITVGLYVDPDIAKYRTTAVSHTILAGPGYDTIQVTFDLGEALVQTIDRTVRRHFRETRAAESRTACPPNTDGLIVVTFAKEPEVQVRWIQTMASEGGGATTELTLSVTAQACDGQPVWRGIAVGYATADKPEASLSWTNPTTEQFQLAVDAALADLSDNLDTAITKADLTRLRTHNERTPG